jgi:uncharacterized lipoprotein YddW (UPF0748 family)
MNIKHLYIKILALVLCVFITMQLFGCSSLTAMQNADSSSQQSSAINSSSSSQISSIVQSSQITVSSSINVSSSSKKTSTSRIASSSKKESSSSKKTSSVSSKAASSILMKPISTSEMRGVWVAELGIDFPNTSGATAQKKEILKIIQTVKNAGLNTIFFQVRPMDDALYKSAIFPWSKYLTGTQGKDPGYDPLAYLIDEAHKSNIAVQAWINPYRICALADFSSLSANNPARIHPEWTITYTDSDKNQDWIWFNPGLPEVRNLITQGVTEIVKNYNIDGIHFDDYFYPYCCKYYEYKSAFNGIKFNDLSTFTKYSNGMSIADFRRNNVNLLVKQVHDEIKAINGNTQFGISPFGIWATKAVMPDGTATIGMSSYSDLFADSKLWVTNRWVDYICPQVYWGFNQPSKPNYNVIVDWWSDLCAKNGVALYIGHINSVVNSGANYWTNNIGINQVQYARQKSAYRGSVYFSYSTLSALTPLLKIIY